MDRNLILQHLYGMWNALMDGDEDEQKISSLILFVYHALQEKWLGMKREKPRPRPKQKDEVEFFLQHIAEL